MWWPLRVAGDRGGRPRGVLWVWTGWDALLRRLLPRREVCPGALVSFRVATYRGRDVRLADGTIVGRGDRIVEVHLDSAALVRASAGGAEPLAAARAIVREIAALRALAGSGALGDVRAIHGTSLLAPGAVAAGAEVRPLPRSVGAAFVRYFFVGLIALHHPRGWAGAAP
ncbi:MAG: hypothetical protein KGN00_04490, partial [Chloroflexota bacterium]|nr:hypothetical protein [Chloroflexota bacterium]